MRRATEEQKAKAAERRARMRGLAATISKMSEDERAALMAKLPGVVTIEGRALSFHNQMMLAMQLPTATVVGGFRQWKTAGRSVMKGQHGAAIWFPLGDKKQDGTQDTSDAGDEKSSCRFGLATVFDIKQTEDSAVAEARRKDAELAADVSAERAVWQENTQRENAVAPLALPAPATAPESPDWSHIPYYDASELIGFNPTS